MNSWKSMRSPRDALTDAELEDDDVAALADGLTFSMPRAMERRIAR